MSVAKWIWYPSDFEFYHHLRLSCRRQEYGCDYPCQWKLNRPEPSMRFRTRFTANEPFSLTVCTHGKGMVRLLGKLWPVNAAIDVPAGTHDIGVDIYDIERFPSIFVDSRYLVTDEFWRVDPFDAHLVPAACEPAFTSPEDDPSVFPFAYTDLTPVSQEETNGGVLWDYGKEVFGPVTLSGLSASPIRLVYGESRAEALDEEGAILRETLTDRDEKTRPARAFRYLWVGGTAADEVRPTARLEYLPIEERASFSAEDPLIKRIWDTAAWTFRLNTREFYLDGIKRDRWVWSGDAYQSYMIARYLYHDESVTERTITALLGKPPVRLHVNTINDYSAYALISLHEYYEATGNDAFVRRVYPNARALYDFILSRLDERGFAVKREGDWIFIDWGVLDKEGPHCCEQILLWRAHLAMARLSALVGENVACENRAAALRERILREFWDEEKGAFIDSAESGRRFVTRQTNVMAALFDFADGGTLRRLVQNAIRNPALPEITTPYFKLFELMALCKLGYIEDAQTYIERYWGGMLKEGATSVWEAYDPSVSGDAHYSMYGGKYAKSLCHAWGSGPILLWCRYCAGVEATSVGAKTFRVAPKPGKYKAFDALIPIGSGEVRLRYRAPEITVHTTATGGVFFDGKNETALIPGETVTFCLQ